MNRYSYLKHYGVKGMRWGVRKKSRKPAELTKADKANLETLPEAVAKPYKTYTMRANDPKYNVKLTGSEFATRMIRDEGGVTVAQIQEWNTMQKGYTRGARRKARRARRREDKALQRAKRDPDYPDAYPGAAFVNRLLEEY